MLVGLEPAGVARDQDVAVQLPVDEGEALRVSPRHHLVAVADSDPELPDGHHLLLGVARVLLEVAPHEMHVAGEGAQVVHRLLGAQVARAQDVLDPAGHEELLELGGEGGGAVGDVQVPEHQHQHPLL